MMLRGVKRSVFQGLSVKSTCSRNFYLTSKTFVRGTIRRNHRPDANEKRLECVNETLGLQKSNINFLGVESEEGVITINSKTNPMQENLMKGKLREKFFRASYGIVRYDSDNKLKYHGQYGNKNYFSFPHKSDDYSEVSTVSAKVTSGIFDATCNNSEDSYKLNTCMKSSKIFVDETHSNNNIKRDESSDPNSSVKHNEDASYIDQYYFSNFSQEKSEDSVQNINDLPSTDELNFLDRNYFRDLTISENPKPCHEQDFITNSMSITAGTDVSDKKFSVINNVKCFDENLESDCIEGRKYDSPQNDIAETFLKCNDNVLQDTLYNEVGMNDKSGRKYINFLNSDKYVNSKQFDNEIEYANMKSNANSTDVQHDLLTKQNNSQFEESAKLYAESNVQSTNNVVTDNHLPKTNISWKGEKHLKVDSEESVDVTDATTAYDFVRNLQKIPEENIKTGNKVLDMKFDSKGFRILKNQVNDLIYFTRDEILNLLKQNILYSDDDLLILNKPYSLVMHDSQTTKSPCLSTFLDELAKEMNQQTADPKLFTVHRLDKETTGCLLLARNETMAQNLKSLFAQRKLIKKYWILTSRVPDPPKGVIDIPITEGSVDNKKRMVLNPEISKDIAYNSHCRRGKQAVTSYKVLSESGNAALVEATPITGIKHQIRVHFGFGLSCPILGDHKYSHLDKLAPQKLPSDILQRLRVRQSKVRYIPLHIHAKSITIPGYFEGRDLYVNAPLPDHMKENLKSLKFRK